MTSVKRRERFVSSQRLKYSHPIAVSGVKQLCAVIRKLEISRASVPCVETWGGEIKTRQLFISKPKIKHALATETYFPGVDIAVYLPRSRFWETKNGFKAEAYPIDTQLSSGEWLLALLRVSALVSARFIFWHLTNGFHHAVPFRGKNCL